MVQLHNEMDDVAHIPDLTEVLHKAFDQLKVIDPDTYTTVVASFLGVARGAVDDAPRRGVAL